ncbi:MAG: hypothetical protein IPO95_13380 [Rhodanobacteraceae bacterium]|nr:hypothetical protein [Rhodanobacteraceae bacterium]
MKWKLEKQGRWAVGEEYPFSRLELSSISKQLGHRNFHFVGDSFYSSLRMVSFLSPRNVLRKLTGRIQSSRGQPERQAKERGSIFDSFISYALVLLAKKEN